jgi:hypothetical protein
LGWGERKAVLPGGSATREPYPGKMKPGRNPAAWKDGVPQMHPLRHQIHDCSNIEAMDSYADEVQNQFSSN